MEALDFSCENKFISFSVILIFIYYLINFIVDHWISTEEKKNVLVTGCDSGFGFQTALELSESNCKVFAGCLTQDGVKRLESNARFRGMAFIMDVTKDEDVQKAKEVIEENGALDGIVNNAGIAIHGLIEWQSIELMKKTFEVNYWGTVRVTKVMLPLLKKSRGRIVNVTSMGGRLSPPYTAPYYGSKYAAEAFSDSLRLEVKPWGVSVHIIEPTFYATGILDEENMHRDWRKVWDQQPQATHDEIGEEQFKNFVSSFFNSIKITQNIGEVTKRIRHALLAKFPRRRYITGLDSKLYAIGSHLPTAFVDWIISCKIGILHPKTTTKKSQ
ncbi:short-chain dehydrogenase/reductase family 9C member 7-like [Clytia hemisphaerica]|uniref:Uncharacterized protein n=1 Tax=Clytia hemisphaerica TaxID=252671 RepID=A0A7M5WWJ9_9CNID